MKLRLAARIALLLGTTWVLIATSPPRNSLAPDCSTNRAEDVTFRVEGTCGPAGEVTISSRACLLTVDGGEAVGLPDEGEQTGAGRLLGSALTLRGVVSDLSQVPRFADGGVDLSSCDGGCPTVFRSCAGAVTDAGAFELSCVSVAAPDCSMSLTPVTP